MNQTVIGLLLDLEVFISHLSSNQLDLGSQMVLSNVLALAMNVSEVAVSYASSNFTSSYLGDDNLLYYNATSYFSSYVNISSNVSDYSSVFDDIAFSLADTYLLQTLLDETLIANHAEYSYDISNPNYAASLINSTISGVNITDYAWDYVADEYYYAATDDAPVYRFKEHVISISVGIVVVGLASIIFIMLNFFPITTYRLMPKSCFKYQLLGTSSSAATTASGITSGPSSHGIGMTEITQDRLSSTHTLLQGNADNTLQRRMDEV